MPPRGSSRSPTGTVDSAPVARYGPVAQAFHWITAIVVLVAFIYGPGGNETRVYSAAKDLDRQLHETLGLAVFVLVFLRLAWRLTHPAPRIEIGRWLDFAGKLGHGLLYALLFILPVTAIAGAWLENHPLTLLGGIRIGPWLAESHDLGKQIAWLHTWLGDAIMWLAGLHAVAALGHHFVLRDPVLVAMLPRWLVSRAPVPRA